MRAVPLVGGPVELRGALDLETTQVGVMPRRLPAWTKEQYQDPSVYGVTVMPSGVLLVFRTDARALEFEVLTSTGQLDADPHPRPTGMLELLVDGAPAGRQQAPVGNVLRMAGPGAVQRLIPGEPGTVRFAGLPAGMKNVELWLPQQTPSGRAIANLGWERIRLPALVFTGDTLYAESEILSRRLSRSRPGEGIVGCRTTGSKSTGEVVLTFERSFLVPTRAKDIGDQTGY